MRESTRGVLFGVAAYGWWGVVAIYFRLLRNVRPEEVLAHRIVWSAVMLAAIVTLMRRWPSLYELFRDRRSVRLLALSASLVAANWYVFIWAVGRDHLLEASLGYFITPLINVLLGFAFLHERLRTLEWASVALAGVAVLWLVVGVGVFPWVSLAVALTFGMYGLVRKIAAVRSLEGLTIETVLLLPIAAGYLIYRASVPDLLLLASGPITALPLLWFASAVQRLRLATVGLLQYISPTIQFALAVAAFGEPFGSEKLIAFVLIWFAIGIYSAANVTYQGIRG
jgi:chloramphenicol-sensitive protein RarD